MTEGDLPPDGPIAKAEVAEADRARAKSAAETLLPGNSAELTGISALTLSGKRVVRATFEGSGVDIRLNWSVLNESLVLPQTFVGPLEAGQATLETVGSAQVLFRRSLPEANHLPGRIDFIVVGEHGDQVQGSVQARPEDLNGINQDTLVPLVTQAGK